MSKPTLGEKLTRWALTEQSVHLLVLIGSRTRAAAETGSADQYSDWDYQIATSRIEMFGDSGWTAALAAKPVAYVARPGRLGSAQKITALFSEGELDLVIIPVAQLRGAAELVAQRQSLDSGPVRQGLIDLSAVLQGGYRMLKGADEFSQLYEYVASNVPPARLSDDTIRQLAEGFVCDYVSTSRKIDRGELIAAQRWLHHQLAETNFRLLHELRQRQGLASYPDARRVELLAESKSRSVEVAALPDVPSLRAAAGKSAVTCRQLVSELVGDSWRWPDLKTLHLGVE